MMKRRVLIVGSFASSWGATTAVCESLAAHLESKGWRVLTTSHKQPRSERLLDMLGVTWRRRREYDVAIVEVYSGPAFVWAEAVCHLLAILGKPYVLSLHGGRLPDFASRWSRRVGSLFAGSAAVVAQSEYLARILPTQRHLVRLIPNPLDLRLYPHRTRIEPQPRLIWLRSFHAIYNPSLAVEVVGLLRDQFPHLVLTMIGTDNGDGSLHAAQTRAEQLHVQQSVVFHAAVPKRDVPRWLDSADIFLNTTNIDNTPVSVQEAMACGLCVVSTNVGGMTYLAQDEVEALLVPPGDADAMAAAVCRVLTEPGLGGRLSQAAHQRVAEMDWSNAIERWERLLTSVSGVGDIGYDCTNVEGATQT